MLLTKVSTYPKVHLLKVKLSLLLDLILFLLDVTLHICFVLVFHINTLVHIAIILDMFLLFLHKLVHHF